jgi:hypothetical protein
MKVRAFADTQAPPRQRPLIGTLAGTSLPTGLGRPGLWMGFALAFAMILAGVFLAGILKAGQWSNLPASFIGSASYFHIGRAWAAGEAPLLNTRPPFYPLLVGLAAKFAGPGRDLELLAALHALLAAAILAGCYELGRRGGRSTLAGVAAVAMAAANLSMLREFLTGRETVVFSALLITIYTLLREGAALTPLRCALMGCLAACAWLTRPTGAIVVLVAGATLFAATRALAHGPRTFARASFVVAVAAPMLTWAGYQRLHLDSIHLSGSSLMENLYAGNNEVIASVYPLLDVETLHPHLTEKREQWLQEGKSPDREFARAAAAFVAAHPLDTLRLAGLKSLAFLSARHFPRGSGRLTPTNEGWSIEDYRPVSPLLDLITLPALPGVLLLGLCLWQWKKLPREARFVTAVIVLTLLLHVATFAETRFRQPFDPLLAVAGVTGVGVWLDQRRNRSRPAPG